MLVWWVQAFPGHFNIRALKTTDTIIKEALRIAAMDPDCTEYHMMLLRDGLRRPENREYYAYLGEQ